MNRFRFGLFLLICVACGFTHRANGQEQSTHNIIKALQTPDSVSGARVNIYQDKRVDMMLINKRNGNAPRPTTPGYRVQVFSSNAQRTAKADAFRIERQIREQFPDVGVYVNYSSPFWKVRVGDFLTHDQAQQFRIQITEAFPQFNSETYIVREQVFLPGNKD